MTQRLISPPGEQALRDRRDGRAAGRVTRVSIVICTLDRANDLATTLESLRWLEDSYVFEVIVVNGPSTDRTAEVISSYGGRVRTYDCPVANLSVSRNIGIRAAEGEVVAFIDDDAVPEPEWLTQLIAAYDDPDVGAAGGFVFDHTGHSFQYRFGTANRFGDAQIDLEAPSPQFSFPFSFEFPHLLGTNASFRRSALLEIGGFDEEFEYFLDETDVLARIVDAGFAIAQLPNAFVHHKFAPSHLRDHNRMVRNRFPILKNKIYFCIKQGRPYVGLDGASRAIADFLDAQRREVRWLIGEGRACEDEAAALEITIEHALGRGMAEGLKGEPTLLRGGDHRSSGRFRAFETFSSVDRLCIVLLSADYPSHRSGGIATFTAALAGELADAGHLVHVITKSPDIDRVDFEHGVWVHRVLSESRPADEAARHDVPQTLWDWSAAAFDEVVRIASHRKVDCVEAPIWDCEAAAFLVDKRWPVLVSLHTTFHVWLANHPSLRDDATWMAAYGSRVLALEKRILEAADGIRANSVANRKNIEEAYELTLDPAKVRTIPMGISWRAAPAVMSSTSRVPETPVTILFVGRLERRKGIDTLLSAVPMVLARHPTVRFRIVGDDSLENEDRTTYRQAFEERADAEMRTAVRFDGRLDDRQLEDAYADCDVFVAPSRYESFGLVYLEAMRAGKPVIGCAVGGVPEVVSERAGILVPPDDPAALAQALVQLADDKALRDRLGAGGRADFETRFTAARMASDSLALYDACKQVHAC